MAKTYRKLILGVENSDQALFADFRMFISAFPTQKQSLGLTYNIHSDERTIFYLLYVSWLMNFVSQVTLAYPFDCKFLVETAHEFPDIDPH